MISYVILNGGLMMTKNSLLFCQQEIKPISPPLDSDVVLGRTLTNKMQNK
jgi:hypothetical protein